MELHAMLGLERDLAEAAFNSAVGSVLKPVSIDQDEQMLVGIYIRYGLATGPHQAHELIRTFREAAAKQVGELGSNLPMR
ncbi:MAG TPA: hypothetical protein VE988_10680 [Gemmataceae bacterium]|nr:hypothetical protein [Gemmataceae bacterium]